jgi:membrane fusion protein (multidrug efflux system)
MISDWPLAGSILVALFVVFSLVACGSETNSKTSEAGNSQKSTEAGTQNADSLKEKTRESREQTTSVKCARAIRSELVMPILAEGTVRARHSAEIRTEIEGRLVSLYAEEGQEVKRNQLLARIDAREYEVAVEEARAEYLQALSRLTVEEDTIEVKELSPYIKGKLAELDMMEQKGTLSHDQRLAREIALDAQALKDGFYRLDIAAARSGVASARSALERARLDLERTEIRAPFAGVVSDITLSKGEQVTKGQLFCNLINDEDIEAEVGVLEADLGSLATGEPALLVFPSLSDTIKAMVNVISPQFSRETRTCQVLIRFQSEDGRVRPGMFVRAVIAGQRFKDRLLVPNEAILTRDGRPLLFKAEGDRAKWLYVSLGPRNGQLVEIKGVLQGGTLDAGDLVVISDHLTLSHDAKIKVKQIIAVGNPWASD